MNNLSANALTCISKFLDLKSIYCTLRCEKRLFKYWQNEDFWRATLRRKGPEVVSLRFAPHFCLEDCLCYKPMLWTHSASASTLPCLRTVVRHFHQAHHLALTAVSESSSSAQWNKVIAHTLADDFEFWSSAGSASDEGEEFLCYSLTTPAIVFWVEMRLPRLYDFPALSYRIRIGREPDSWDFVSSSVEAVDSPHQHYFVVLPAVVVGKFVRLDLIGKKNKNVDGNFYVNVEKVACAGLALADIDRPERVESDYLPPQLTIQTAEYWIRRLTQEPCFLTREFVHSLCRFDQIHQYFEVLSEQPRRNTAMEVSLVADFYEQLKRYKRITPNLLFSEEVGDLFFSRGEVARAKECFVSRKCFDKAAKCMLMLKEYQQCLEMLTAYAVLSVHDLKNIARSISVDTAEELEAYLIQPSSPR